MNAPAPATAKKTAAKKTAAAKPAPDSPAEQAAPPAPRNIIEALVAVMREVGHVGKDSHNQHGNFNFRGIDAVINALGPAMRKVGVIARPEVLTYSYGDVEVGKNRTRQAHVQVQVRYHFHFSGPDGQMTSLSADVPAEAMDSGDKATAKAMSVAMRIALLQTFALPTTEPDPDHYNYERSQAPSTTAGDIYAAVGWAAKEDDFAAAFNVLRERFGAELFSVMVENRAGEPVRADQYLAQAEAATAEFRARNAAEAQDTDAQGPTTDVAAPETRAPEASAPAQDARASEAAPAPAQDAPAPQEAAQAAPAAQQPGETRAQQQLRLAVDELMFQADALKVNVNQWAGSIMDTPGDLDTLNPARTVRFLIEQRQQVIPALRDQGRATEADAYERLGEAFPILVAHITEPDPQEAAKAEPSEAPAQ